MNKKVSHLTEGKKCPICGQQGIREIREDTIFGGVWVENVPFEYCPNCHERYCDLATSQTLEEIANNPAKFAKMLERPVAHVA